MEIRRDNITKFIVRKMIDERKSFTLKEIQEQIHAKNGYSWVEPGTSVEDYLDSMEYLGILSRRREENDIMYCYNGC